MCSTIVPAGGEHRESFPPFECIFSVSQATMSWSHKAMVAISWLMPSGVWTVGVKWVKVSSNTLHTYFVLTADCLSAHWDFSMMSSRMPPTEENTYSLCSLTPTWHASPLTHCTSSQAAHRCTSAQMLDLSTMWVILITHLQSTAPPRSSTFHISKILHLESLLQLAIACLIARLRFARSCYKVTFENARNCFNS